ncbi:MAG: nucleotide exchange factor GrpE [Candidatus Micrarchaeales archaeon]
MAEDKEEKVEEKQPEDNKEEENYKERMLRLAAEFDNYKKRVRKDIDDAKRVGKAETIKNLLPVLDEFELAVMSVNGNADEVLAKGIEMLYSNFREALKKEGLAEIKASGIYDPYRHEIIMTKEDNKKKPGTILEVIKKGYMLGEIILRPATVIIAKEKVDIGEKYE